MTPHNLPHQSTPFVGRGSELAEIAALLADPTCQLLTLLGAGGIGKTRLALQAAADQLPRFAQGIFFVSLAPVTSPDLLASAIASALQVTFNSPEDMGVQIARYLREKHILLLLDNFDHLLEGVGLLPDILQAAPNVKFLVTSRERLNVKEEWVLTLDGLHVPNDQAAEPLGNYSAVQLFVQRARQVQANFSLTDNTEAVKTICQRVEGMPLGLELAASWLRAMSCQQIAAQVAGSIKFLSTPLRNVPERHRSLGAVFEQSWNMLSEAEQQILMRLSIFRGGFDLEAAEHVAGASLPLLAGLVDKSLIRLNDTTRYDLHELLRQYAADKLTADASIAAAAQHLAYFLNLAEQAAAHNFGREQIPWYNRLEVELNNLRTALAWSLQSEEAGIGLQLAATLGWFFTERSHWIEGLAWFEQLFAAEPNVPPLLRAKALHSAGAVAGIQGNPRARPFLEEALALARAANASWDIAWSLSHIGNYIWQNPDLSAAALDESLELFRELDDRMGIAHTLIRRAWIVINHQTHLDARSLLDEAFILAREAGDKVITAWVTFTLGMTSLHRDHDLRQAKSQLEMSVSLFREAHFQIGSEIYWLAVVELALGNVDRAQTLFEECLILRGEIASSSDFHTLTGLASVATARGQFERAAILFGITESFHIPEAKIHPEVFTYASDVEVVRAQLGEAAFDEVWAAGKAMTREQIFAYALENRITNSQTIRSESAGSQTSIDPLSARELEILQLIAEGLTNAEIAQKLSLAVGTVKVHTSNIYGKLGVNSRTQAVAEAQKLTLL